MRNTCKADDCNNFVITRGLCDKHRKRLDRGGSLESSRPIDWGKRESNPLYVYWNDVKRRETLNICDEWKNDFWSFIDYVVPRPSKDYYLRAVDINKTLGPNNWQWVKGITDANRQILSRAKARSHDKARLRLSAEEREKHLTKANHKCEICEAEFSDNDCPVTGKIKTKSLCIDHCHKTGKIRGVLCRACNSGLGHLKDSTELLRKAVLYLERN